MMTFLAPPSMCARALVASVKMPVDSMTMSAPASPHAMSAGLRSAKTFHRRSGRALIPLALVVALTGLWMTHFYPWPAGDGMMVYVERLIVGVAMLVFIVRGVQAIRVRDFASHGEWMTRAYAIALGAGTQVFTHLPWFILVDRAPGELPRGIMMGAAWAINVIVAEWLIRRARSHLRPGGEVQAVGQRHRHGFAVQGQRDLRHLCRSQLHQHLHAAPRNDGGMQLG